MGSLSFTGSNSVEHWGGAQDRTRETKKKNLGRHSRRNGRIRVAVKSACTSTERNPVACWPCLFSAGPVSQSPGAAAPSRRRNNTRWPIITPSAREREKKELYSYQVRAQFVRDFIPKLNIIVQPFEGSSMQREKAAGTFCFVFIFNFLSVPLCVSVARTWMKSPTRFNTWQKKWMMTRMASHERRESFFFVFLLFRSFSLSCESFVSVRRLFREQRGESQ